MRKNIGIKIFTTALIVFLSLSSVLNLNLLVGALKTAREDDLGFGELVGEIKTSYTSDFKSKDAYINFNGLFARLSGRTVYNNVALLENGMLVNDSVNKSDTDTYSKNIIEFSEYLESTDREFLYVQAPYKLDIKGELTNDGIVNYANVYADEMVSALNTAKVDTLDLRPFLSADAKTIEKYFYNTDHHWNTSGAFLGYTKVVEKIQDMLRLESIDEKYTSEASWNKKTYKDIFLGSLGKRVGKYYAGVDDLTYYYPDFKTNMSCYVPKHSAFYKGDFADAVIRKNQVEKVDYFNLSPYSVYLGGDYPIVQHRNPDAPYNLKVLIIRESFSAALQSFMSTVFSEVEALDPRHYKDSSIAEYIECYNPDLVMLMVNPSIMGASYYFNYGIEKAQPFNNAKNEVSVFENKDIEVAPTDSAYNYVRVTENLSANTKYTVSFEDIDFKIGKGNLATVALFNADTKQLVSSQSFDIDYCRKTDSFEWSFITPDTSQNFCLLVYAGAHGKTENKHVIWKNCSMKKYN